MKEKRPYFPKFECPKCGYIIDPNDLDNVGNEDYSNLSKFKLALDCKGCDAVYRAVYAVYLELKNTIECKDEDDEEDYYA